MRRARALASHRPASANGARMPYVHRAQSRGAPRVPFPFWRRLSRANPAQRNAGQADNDRGAASARGETMTENNGRRAAGAWLVDVDGQPVARNVAPAVAHCPHCGAPLPIHRWHSTARTLAELLACPPSPLPELVRGVLRAASVLHLGAPVELECDQCGSITAARLQWHCTPSVQLTRTPPTWPEVELHLPHHGRRQ